jgi:hypothetical protein
LKRKTFSAVRLLVKPSSWPILFVGTEAASPRFPVTRGSDDRRNAPMLKTLLASSILSLVLLFAPLGAISPISGSGTAGLSPAHAEFGIGLGGVYIDDGYDYYYDDDDDYYYYDDDDDYYFYYDD